MADGTNDNIDAATVNIWGIYAFYMGHRSGLGTTAVTFHSFPSIRTSRRQPYM